MVHIHHRVAARKTISYSSLQGKVALDLHGPMPEESDSCQANLCCNRRRGTDVRNGMDDFDNENLLGMSEGKFRRV